MLAEALEQSLEVSHRGGADTVYQVGVETIQREGLAEQYSYETDADLFLWVSQMLRDLLSTTSNADFSDAVAAAKAQVLAEVANTRYGIVSVVKLGTLAGASQDFLARAVRTTAPLKLVARRSSEQGGGGRGDHVVQEWSRVAVGSLTGAPWLTATSLSTTPACIRSRSVISNPALTTCSSGLRVCVSPCSRRVKNSMNL